MGPKPFSIDAVNLMVTICHHAATRNTCPCCGNMEQQAVTSKK